MHRARVQRGLSLEAVAAASQLPLSVVARVDEGRFDELPAGIYARAYVRAVAAALGLEPEATLDELGARLPGVPDPIVAMQQVLREPHVESDMLQPLTSMWGSIRAAAAHVVPHSNHASAKWRPRTISACVDALILIVINAAAVSMAAVACGETPPALLRSVPGPLVLLFLVTSVQYFVVLAGIEGQTAGERACGLPARDAGVPRRASDIMARGARAWMDEGSVLVNAAVAWWFANGTSGSALDTVSTTG